MWWIVGAQAVVIAALAGESIRHRRAMRKILDAMRVQQNRQEFERSWRAG